MEKEDDNISKLSTEEKCDHKNWKARVAGYEELIKIFNNLDDAKTSEWNKYGNIVRKFPCDSNAAAQEKGLEATLAFLENAPSTSGSRIVSEVMEAIVTKCVIALKAKSKDIAANIALMSVEIEKYETVQDELLKGLDHKNPKIVAGCIGILHNCLAQFGLKIFSVKTVIKKILTLIEDRDKVVRDETKKVLVEFYRWVGPSFKTQLSAIKPSTLQEIETEVLNFASEKAVPTRFLRSELAARESEAAQQEENDNENKDVSLKSKIENQPDLDPLDALEPYDILSNLPKGFYEKCEDKKWQERKETLEKVDTLLAVNPKLENGDYSDLVRMMKQVLTKDAHIVVSTLAAKIISNLAKGLGKKFSPFANQCISGIFGKFKEKKTSVVNTLRDACDACFAVISLESIQEEALQALQNKNPAIKLEVSLFMARCFLKTPGKVFSDKKIMTPLLQVITANVNVSDPNVRDAAAEALGIALKILGDKPLAAFTQELDAMKLQKVKEFAEKANVKPIVKESKPIVKTASAKKSLSATSSAKVAKVSSSDSESKSSNSKTDAKKAATFRIVKGKPIVAAAVEETIDRTENALEIPVNNSKSQRISDEAKNKILRWNFTSPREEFVELLKELMGNAGLSKQLISNMFHVDFKFHLKALETLVGDLKTNGHEGALSNLDLILKWLSIRFFDTNPSVLTRSLDYIQMLFEDLEKVPYKLVEVETYSFVPYLVLKIGDSKDNVRSSVHTILKILCRVSSPHRICLYIMDGLKSKNARQRVECLEEVAYMIPLHGLKMFSNPSSGLKEIAKQIADRDTAVRNAALNALVQAYFIDENKFYKMIGLLNAKDQSLLDERIKRAVKPTKTQLPAEKPKKIATEEFKTAQSPRKDSSPKISGSGRQLNRSFTVTTGPKDISNSTSIVSIENTENEPFLANESTSYPPEVDLEEENLSKTLLPTVEDLESDMFTIVETKGVPATETPKPNPYLIDFDEIDRFFDADEITVNELKLYDTNIDDILNEPPITLPKIRARTRSVLSSRPCNKGFMKPSVEGLDYTIAQTGSSEMRVVIASLINLDVLIADEKFHESLSEKVDNILSMAALQFRRMHPALGCLPVNVTDDVNQYFLCVLNTLKSIYKTGTLSKCPQKENTKELLYFLLVLITEPNLIALPDAKRIIKEMNLLVVPILEKSSHVVIISALIRLLNETTLYLNGTNTRVINLILKCLWKVIKQMGVWAKENVDWDLAPILSEYHMFMTSHPFCSYIGQDDMPIRTIKTVMHTVTMIMGAEKMESQLSEIPKLANSEGGAYISKICDRERGKPSLDVRRKSYEILTGGKSLPENCERKSEGARTIDSSSNNNGIAESPQISSKAGDLLSKVRNKIQIGKSDENTNSISQ